MINTSKVQKQNGKGLYLNRIERRYMESRKKLMTVVVPSLMFQKLSTLKRETHSSGGGE